MIIAGIYFGVGLLSLIVLDLCTKRIRTRIKDASIEAAVKISDTGNYVTEKMALILTLVALFIFWPAAIYGALTPRRKGKDNG